MKLDKNKFSQPKMRPEFWLANVSRRGFPQTPFLLILTDTMKLSAGSAGAAFRHPCRTASSAKKPLRNHPRGLKRPQRLPKVPPKTPQKPAQNLPTGAKRPRKRHLPPRSVCQDRRLCQNAGKGTCTMTVFVTAVVHHSRNRISGFAL